MPWALLGQSVIGTAHRSRNIPCQDASRFVRFAEERAVIVVADGAGSAAHAEIGANCACDAFLERITARESITSKEEMAALYGEVRAVLVAEAELMKVSPRELACTALVAVVGPDSAVVAQIGDGAIVLGDGEAYRTAFWPEPAEYANTTDFLTDERYASALQFDLIAGTVPEVALLTDGLQRVALDFAARTPHQQFFRPLFAGVRSAVDVQRLSDQLREFLDSPRINERTDDDKTLVIAVSRP
jgi:hypothetical protein